MRGKKHKSRKWIRQIAFLMSVLMLSTELPVMYVAAAQMQGTISENANTVLTEVKTPADNLATEGEMPTDEATSEVKTPADDPTTEGEMPTDEAASENKTSADDSAAEDGTSTDDTVSENETSTEDTTVSENMVASVNETLSDNDTGEVQRPMLPIIEHFELPNSETPEPLQMFVDDKATLESSYDSRTLGILPPVRNQYAWGTCWAFATMGIMESSLIQQGLVTQNGIDLSERHLAYFAHHTGNDALDNANGDTITTTPDSFYLENGGNIMKSTSALMNWQGAAQETAYPYQTEYTQVLPENLERTAAQDADAIIKNCYFVNTEANDEASIQAVKALIKEYGIVMWSYYDDDACYNSATKAYYNNSVSKQTNHAITVVGWDDNFSASNFNTAPSANGAWIVRNSWGTSFGEQGYFYISYEDTSLGCGNAAAVMIADLAGDYDNNYFHTNTLCDTWEYGTKVAQVYQIKGQKSDQERISAVSFMLFDANAEYSIQLYKNPDTENGIVSNPESGTALLTTPITGTASYQGVYTVDLPTSVVVEKDDAISIVITFPEVTYVAADPKQRSVTNSVGTLTTFNELEYGESFVYYNYGSGLDWYDLANDDFATSLRINMLTNDITENTVVPVVTAEAISAENFVAQSSVNLKWNYCVGAETFEVYRADSAEGEYIKLADVAIKDRKYQDKIDAGTTYYYKVKAVFADSSTQESDAVKVEANNSIKFPVFNAMIKNMQSVLSWNAIEGASGYEIQRKSSTETDYTNLVNITEGAAVSYQDDVLLLDFDTYSYRIRAYASDGRYTEWSEVRSITVDFKLEQLEYDKIKFSCPEYPGAYWYFIWVSVGNTRYGSGHASTTIEKDMSEWLTKNQKTYVVGDDYSYYLEVRDSDNNSLYTFPAVTFRTVPDPIVFENLETVDLENPDQTDSTGITLTWSGGAGADSVAIYRSHTKKRPETPYITVSAGETSYTDTDIQKGKAYYYWLSPTVTNSLEEVVQGVVTEEKSVEIPLLDKATILKSVEVVSATETTISWEMNALTEGYHLYRSEVEDEFGELITEVTDKNVTTFKDTGLKPGVTYYYSIADYIHVDSVKTEGLVSPQIAVRTMPEAVVLDTPVILVDGTVQLQWTPGNGADGYLIERAIKGETFEQIGKIELPGVGQYQDAAAINDMLYQYRVTAYNVSTEGNTQCAEASNVVEIATPLTPISIREVVSVSENELHISWDVVEGAESYALYRSENAETDFVLLWEITAQNTASDNVVSYFDADRMTGKTYYYKVLIRKNGQESLIGETQASSGRTIPATPVCLKNQQDSVTIANNPNFEYAIGTIDVHVSELSFVSSQEETLTFSGLTVGTSYCIYVRTKQSITGETPVYGIPLNLGTAENIELMLSHTSIVLSKGNSTELTASLQPSDIYYTGLRWSAVDAKGNAYPSETVDGIFTVRGHDGKDILRIVHNTIYAVAESSDKEVYLQAAIGNITAECKVIVNVPVTGLAMQVLQVNGVEKNTLVDFKVRDEAVLGVTYVPGYNADDTTCYWTSSDSAVASVAARDSQTVTLKANGTGSCVITARTADGVSVAQKIIVSKAEEVYGIWLSAEDMTGKSVSADADGNWVTAVEKTPEYSLNIGKNAQGTQVQVTAYALTESTAVRDAEGNVTGGTLVGILADSEKVMFRSANSQVAEVSKLGVISAKAPGVTDIFAYDANGNAVYGKCRIIVSGDAAPEETLSWPIDKAYKLSAVNAKIYLQSYGLDEKSSARLRIKDQYGNEYTSTQMSELFTFTSADTSICMVDKTGEVVPNPELDANKTVYVTATLKGDLGKRKVVFKVTVLTQRQINSIELKKISAAGTDNDTATEIVRQKFVQGETLTFAASAYDSQGNQMEGALLQWKVTDQSVASVKDNKDQTVTVTVKKPGRVNLICTAKDTWKTTERVQLAFLNATPTVSVKQVTMNKAYAMTADTYRRSDKFRILVPEGAKMTLPEITEVRAGKTVLPSSEKANFRIVDNLDGSYSIEVNNKQSYADNLKNNGVYEVELKSNVTGIPELGDVAASFGIQVKVISKTPGIKVSAGTVNRIYAQATDLKTLLTVKAPEAIENIRVLSSVKEDQINEFDRYFTAEKVNGRWYLQYDKSKAYDKSSIKGKIAVQMEGYDELICTVNVKVQDKDKSIKQSVIPSIYTKLSNVAEISLYNETDKVPLSCLKVSDVSSDKLAITLHEDGTILATIKSGVEYKDGETMTAVMKVMEQKATGADVWTRPVEVKVSLKAYVTSLPKVTVKNKTLILNKATASEGTTTELIPNCQNVQFAPYTEWKVLAYNAATKQYDIDMSKNSWLRTSYQEETDKFVVGFQSGKAARAEEGTYKLRVANVIKGCEDVCADFTVKVVDKEPTVKVKVSGKLDLVRRKYHSLSGKLNLKNITAPVQEVVILNEKKTEQHPYYTAVYRQNQTFDIVLTDAGMRAELTTSKQTLPVKVILENGHVLQTELTLKPIQSTPKVTVPTAQTIFKSGSNMTRDYDLTRKRTAGTQIKRVDVVNAPAGMGIITKEGHILVTLADKGIKSGNYAITVNIFFEGAQPVAGYPNGKPVTTKLTIRVAE